ncbi:two-component system sensor histidine kinase QseC [Pasteurellaceae bacterium 15-036681]|nr:two-component system sensor histidine kinase QseC [Pasteurellaceae bacterium 15-036681]
MKLIKNTSLRIRLIIVLSCTALAIWFASTSVAWLQVRKDVNEVFDAQQILFAQRLASSNLRNILVDRRPEHQFGAKRKGGFRKVEFDDDALGFAIFTDRGDVILSDGKTGDLFPFTPAVGFNERELIGDDDKWRIYWLPVAGGRLFIAVGQELDYREDLIEKMVFSQMWIWFASLPLLLTLMIFLINHELKSLKQVSQKVEQRKPEDTDLLPTLHIPSEILPLVNNLNQFFDKTSNMLIRERRFTSDAAHELRSPLAALKIQTELAQLAGDDVQMRERALTNLTQGIDRATQLIEQLLTLSRLDNLKQLEGVEDIYWDKLIPSLIGELYFHAQKRNIEIKFEHIATPQLSKGQPLLLSLMLRNLVDNAIKYCPKGSIIQVVLEGDKIIVQDNGGGVSEEDLAKLGQRFYRPAGQNEKGSGLGLSIVHRIAELHLYKLKLENSKLNDKLGLKANVYL